jgi:hypothetical protein
MKKIVIFAFQGELMCFAHAMLNAIDLNQKGHDCKLVIEGSATALIGKLADESTPFHQQYKQIVDEKILAGVCKACSSKMKTLKEAEKQNLTLLDDMKGHPSFASYLAEGYKIISM